jgi:hypothetical protein
MFCRFRFLTALVLMLLSPLLHAQQVLTLGVSEGTLADWTTSASWPSTGDWPR